MHVLKRCKDAPQVEEASDTLGEGEWGHKGRWDYVVGLVGKPQAHMAVHIHT